MSEGTLAPRVFLAMPSGYGTLTLHAARGYWRATRRSSDRVVYAQRGGSLLAAGFNHLWVDALNYAHEGRAPDYFAMQHADIEPEDWWLDTLIEEMEERDLDLLGVVAPIKDMRGLTSIALARPDGDTWRPLCRLTMSEIFSLPETFTSEDVGYPILLNTGLWVCRFNEEWARQVSFTINDRIVYSTADKRYHAQCEPEDWYFSRLCHEMGLKVGATRKIKLAHRGDMSFTNERPWGTDRYDTGWIDHSVVFEMPNVTGWLRPEEGAALERLARGKRVLEIGSYFGLSTVCMARVAESLTSVDPHDGRGTAEPGNTLPKFRENLAAYGLTEKVNVIVGTSTTAELTGPFDLVFIDGAHDAESVRADVIVALGVLAPGGVIAFHDYRSLRDPGVALAVDEFIAASGSELMSVSGTVAAVRPPAFSPLALGA